MTFISIGEVTAMPNKYLSRMTPRMRGFLLWGVTGMIAGIVVFYLLPVFSDRPLRNPIPYIIGCWIGAWFVSARYGHAFFAPRNLDKAV